MNSFFSLQKLTDAANANSNALKSVFDIGLDAGERFVALNFAAMRSLSAGYKPVGEDVFQQFSGQFKAPMQGVEQATDYLRNVNDIYVKAQADIARVNSERLSGVSQQVNELLDDVARTGPAGTAEVVGKVKTALNSVTEAYENILRTTREATEHQFAAASNALQPIVASAKASKKAA